MKQVFQCCHTISFIPATTITTAVDHTDLKVPDPIRTPKASKSRPGQYQARGLPGNTKELTAIYETSIPVRPHNYSSSNRVSFIPAKTLTTAVDQTDLTVPDPIRTPKASKSRPGQYQARGLPGNTEELTALTFVAQMLLCARHIIRQSRHN